MKCSVPDRTGKDVQSELSSCETMQSKCVCSQCRSSKWCGVCMFATGSSSTISGTLRLAWVAIGLIASQWYLGSTKIGIVAVNRNLEQCCSSHQFHLRPPYTWPQLMLNPLDAATIYIYGRIKLPVVAATIYICSRQVRSLSVRS